MIQQALQFVYMLTAGTFEHAVQCICCLSGSEGRDDLFSLERLKALMMKIVMVAVLNLDLSHLLTTWSYLQAVLDLSHLLSIGSY